MKTLEYALAMGTIPSKLDELMTSLEKLNIQAKIVQGDSPIEFKLQMNLPEEVYNDANSIFVLGALVGGSIARSWM